jgi:hypothetical protein
MQDSSKPLWVKPKVQQLVSGYKPYNIFLATPVHSDVSIHYAQSLLEFQKYCFENKIKVTFQLFKSSLITQGRNLCVGGFMETGHSHLLFIDADIDFQAKSIQAMIDKDKDVISVPYPMKTFNWDKMYDNFKAGKIKNPQVLSMNGNTYPMRLPDEENIKIENGCIEVSHSPTGCMLIKRSVIEKMIEKYPEMRISQPTIINGKAVEKPFLYNFFDTMFDPVTHTYMGEDFAFCKRWKDIGGKCHAIVDQLITHVGEHQYCGRFSDELIQLPKNDIKTEK